MWPVTSSRTAYENDWIRVTHEEVITPDGRPGQYGVVEIRRPAVFVVALTDADEVALVWIDRHTTGGGWEVPAGGADVHATDDPDAPLDASLLDAARRELAEETGLTASEWRPIGCMDALNGVCRAPEHVFLARGLTQATASGQEEEGIGAVRFVPWAEALQMVADGSITDGETIACLLFAALALGRLR